MHCQSIDIAPKFIQLFETFAACHLMVNRKEEFDEANIDKFSMRLKFKSIIELINFHFPLKTFSDNSQGEQKLISFPKSTG